MSLISNGIIALNFRPVKLYKELTLFTYEITLGLARNITFIYNSLDRDITFQRQARMQTTKGQILALLKRSGGSTVDDLAVALGLASMTVRQHLVALERDALISSHEVRRPTGRPHYFYTLTEQGHNTFAGRYDHLAESILREVAELNGDSLNCSSGEERLRLVITRLADRMAEAHRLKVEGRPLSERVPIVTDILKREGGFAEWGQLDTGYEIRDYNCVYRRVLEAYGFADCQWHSRFLTQLLDRPVTFENPADCLVFCCRYVVGR